MERDLKGTIFIIDISYYINHITDIDNEMRSGIIAKLLKSIIRANHLSFLISEVEDNVILFSCNGPAFSLPVVLKQLEAILASLSSELNLLKYYLPVAHQPSVRFIIHYSNPDNLQKTESHKLQGTVMEGTYSLPKSKVVLHMHTLITNQYIEAQTQEVIPTEGRVCELYSANTPRNLSWLTSIFSKTA